MQMTADLFDDLGPGWQEVLAPGAVVLRRFALPFDAQLREALRRIEAATPFRHMLTPGGRRMSVAMTNCGKYGWVTDRAGYRYTCTDPESGLAWPPMPALFQSIACPAAGTAGFPGFSPDACLINRYAPGARMSLHQDRDEADPQHPIVSVSLGVPALFLFGGLKRGDKPLRVPLAHGDVVVWGGPARLRYHGILPLKHAIHPWAGEYRFNLTFRRAV